MSTKEHARSRAIFLPKQVILGDQRVVRLAERLGNGKPDAQKITDPNVLTFVERWIHADQEHEHGQWLAGEIYWLYFRATPETQSTFIEQMAVRNRLDAPDAAWTPRQRLIVALYGNDPKDVDDGDGKYDSRAGKRITAAIRVYEERAGIRRRKRKVRAIERLPRTTKMFLSGLFEIASPTERSMLERLIARKFGRKATAALPVAA